MLLLTPSAPSHAATRFREDVEVEARMQAVGGIIANQGFPHFLCFQARPNSSLPCGVHLTVLHKQHYPMVQQLVH